MSFLEFYLVSLVVCFCLTVIFCKLYNSLPKHNTLHMEKQTAEIFTVLSIVPICNVIVLGMILCITIWFLVEKITSKFNFYK